MLEAVVTMLLTTIVMGGIFDAMLVVSAHSTRPMQDSALMNVAQNIITGLRSSVAYYNPQDSQNPLRALYGKAIPATDVSMPMPAGAPAATTTVQCDTAIGNPAPGETPDPSAPNSAVPVNVSVHCHNPSTGSDVTVTSALYNEAPVPGSVVYPSPPPS